MLNFLIGLYAVPEPSIFRCPKKNKTQRPLEMLVHFLHLLIATWIRRTQISRLSVTSIIIIYYSLQYGNGRSNYQSYWIIMCTLCPLNFQHKLYNSKRKWPIENVCSWRAAPMNVEKNKIGAPCISIGIQMPGHQLCPLEINHTTGQNAYIPKATIKTMLKTPFRSYGEHQATEILITM